MYLYLVNHSNVFKGSFSDALPRLPKTLTKPKLDAPKFPSTLDGSLVPEPHNTRHALGVMIENHPDARPQYGLSSASFVYEAIAEGGITRFLAIFGSHDASKVGPVRSARTYYADWCNEYDCYYAHVGGAQDGLAKIRADKIKDLDQFANAKAYKREPRNNVATEHTMFSSTGKLYDLASNKKWGSALREDYGVFTFIDDPTSASTIAPTHPKISINFSAAPYAVSYDYDVTTNSYKRELAGTAHIDAENNQQIAPKNIIIQHTARSKGEDERAWTMTTIGSGKAVIYQGGKKIDGTWKKTDKYSRTLFYDANNDKISLYRGSTWIEVVNPGSVVTDTP